MPVRKDKANTAGQMEIDMLENGLKICSTAKVSLFGMMIGFILVIGKTT